MRKRIRDRVLAGILAAVLLCTTVPETVYAVEGTEGTEQLVQEQVETEGRSIPEENKIPLNAVRAGSVIGDDYPAKYKNALIDSIVDEWKFYNRECTSFVAWRLNSKNGVPFTNGYKGAARWGHAKTWGTVAKGLGITVDNTPAVGAVWWSNVGTYGHVAWVAAVNGNLVTIEEYNYNNPGGYQCRDNILASSATGYIHINDMVEAPPTPLSVPVGKEMNGPFTRTIPNGDYHIVSALEGERFKLGPKCLTISGLPNNKDTNFAKAELRAVNGRKDHVFTVKWLDESRGYSIEPKDSQNHYFDVDGGSVERGGRCCSG